jgi:GLPGLI family protein
MKKILLIAGLLISVIAGHVVLGQTPEGVITYEVKLNMHKRFTDEQEGMKNMVPEFATHHDRLVFAGQESLYQPVEEEAEEFASEEGGRALRIRRPRAQFYFNHALSRRVVAQEFAGRHYLIEDAVTVAPWKLSDESKTIHGYVCKQAAYYDEDRKQNVIAWYSSTLPPFLGPEGFNSLPGTVLQVEINEGERLITAKEIEMRPLKKTELKIPAKGQRTSEKEFRALVEEHRKRAGANGGIIIRN